MPQAASPLFETVALLGVGLMGGSLGLAIRERGLARETRGYARREATRNAAVERGLVDEVFDSPEAAARGADLIVLATPILSYEGLLTAIRPALKPGALVTDLGSAKASVVALCEGMLNGTGARFVGGHPMAGSEESGPEAARADLYEGATWCLTPIERTDPGAVSRIATFAEAVGARVLLASPEEHDRAVAASSHAPHLAAVALTLALATAAARNPLAEQLIAGGFRDTTRVASGSPAMWRDIGMANRDAILAALDDLRGALDLLEEAIRDGDGPALEATLEAARAVRERLINPPPDES